MDRADNVLEGGGSFDLVQHPTFRNSAIRPDGRAIFGNRPLRNRVSQPTILEFSVYDTKTNLSDPAPTWAASTMPYRSPPDEGTVPVRQRSDDAETNTRATRLASDRA
jgi:hypothetical protein